MFDAILFDCDGVLVDSEILSTRALQRSLNRLGISVTEQEVADTYTGHSFPDCVAMVEQRLGRSIDDIDAFMDDNRRYSEQLMRSELKPMPGIEAQLAGLPLPYALVTNSRTAELALKLEVTGLERFFPESCRFDCEKLGVAKPDPAIYRLAAERLGVDIRRSLVIEDSGPGLAAASGAGATVWAYRPHVEGSELERLGVQRVFHHWDDFPLNG